MLLCQGLQFGGLVQHLAVGMLLGDALITVVGLYPYWLRQPAARFLYKGRNRGSCHRPFVRKWSFCFSCPPLSGSSPYAASSFRSSGRAVFFRPFHGMLARKARMPENKHGAVVIETGHRLRGRKMVTATASVKTDRKTSYRVMKGICKNHTEIVVTDKKEVTKYSYGYI